jgi:hypothetical protein
MAILQSRARYGLSAFSFLKPELPGSVNNEPGPQLDCAAAKFLPRSPRQPSLWRVWGTSLLIKDSAGRQRSSTCRLRASDVADSATSPWQWWPRLPCQGASAIWRRSPAADQIAGSRSIRKP